LTDAFNFDESFGVKGKNVIVTGSSSGIGLEIVRMFARKGANILAFDRNENLELEAYVKPHGVDYLELKGDITDSQSIRDLVDTALGRFGKIDALINCAGIGILESCAQYTEETWDKTLAVNLTGPVRLAVAVGSAMIATGGGSIVNIASQAGVVALDKHLAYGTAKAGLIQATKQMALEWGQYNIRVNAISPTVILTPMGRMSWDNPVGEAFKQSIPSRRFGYPEEVAACVVYLVSDASALFNGANLVIDGGYTIQ
jgi:NAD(P)-dependent dehydrogenase (short-subunit alcohol dehydrogenase family)